MGAEMVRGKGAPLLTVDETEINPTDRVWVVRDCVWSATMTRPTLATVIGVDLTRRTCQLQYSDGREEAYCAKDARSNSRLFGLWDAAAKMAMKKCVESIAFADRKADEAIETARRLRTEFEKVSKELQCRAAD